MKTIKNGRKRGCGSCGQSESYESMLLDKPVIRGILNGSIGPLHTGVYRTGRDIREIRGVVKLPLDKVTS